MARSLRIPVDDVGAVVLKGLLPATEQRIATQRGALERRREARALTEIGQFRSRYSPARSVNLPSSGASAEATAVARLTWQQACGFPGKSHTGIW
jgi:hypothetical protein